MNKHAVKINVKINKQNKQTEQKQRGKNNQTEEENRGNITQTEGKKTRNRSNTPKQPYETALQHTETKHGQAQQKDAAHESLSKKKKVRKTKKKGLFLGKGVQDRSR